MKGLLYNSLIMNRTYLIAEAIFTLCSAVLGVVTILCFGQSSFLFVVLPMLLPTFPLVAVVIPLEGISREVEKHIQSRYLDYALTAVTRTCFALAELIKNITLMLIAYAASMLLIVIFNTVKPAVISDDIVFKLIPCAVVITGLIQWLVIPLTLKLKSCEKAGMVVGLGLGGIIGAFVAVVTISGNTSAIQKMLDSPWLLPIYFCSVIVLYAVFWFILLKTLERGNIC